MRWRLCGLVVFVAWLAVSAGGSELSMNCLPADGGVPDNTTLGGCPACRLRSEVKEKSLAAIKHQVLGSLGYIQAPNITGKTLPVIHPNILENIKRENEAEMMSDQANRYSVFEEEDDYRATTEKIFVFHQYAEYRPPIDDTSISTTCIQSY